MHHRKAVLSFVAHLDTTELPLFFVLLIKPLQVVSHESNEISSQYWSPGGISMDDFVTLDFLKYFTIDNMAIVPWKKIYGFLHVVEDILGTFDEFHLGPFLNLLMGIVIRILACCTSGLNGTKVIQSSSEDKSASFKQIMGEDSEAGNYTVVTLYFARMYALFCM